VLREAFTSVGIDIGTTTMTAPVRIIEGSTPALSNWSKTNRSTTLSWISPHSEKGV